MKRAFGVFVALFGLSACATQEEAVIIPASSTEARTINTAPTGPGNYMAGPDVNALLAQNNADISRLQAEVQTLRKEVDGLKAALNASLSAAPAPAQQPALPQKPVKTPTAAKPATSVPVPAQSQAQEAKPQASAPLSGNYGVHLASYRSKALAVDGWQALQRKYGDRIKGFKPQVTTLEIGGTEGTYYRLIVGPFKSHEDATTLCTSITAEQDYCVVTAYGGVPLE